ncbi:hypothetical protein, partial [Bifidobacterium longum]|uniref:hypothetical protein n=1 Tax=Bifidobacterium longum TaxID=216816 RepID=UPI001E528D40
MRNLLWDNIHVHRLMLMLSHNLWDNIGKTPIFAFRPTRTIMQTCAYEYWVLSTDGKNPILMRSNADYQSKPSWSL